MIEYFAQFFTPTMIGNLVLMFILAIVMIGSWWGVVRLVNWSMGINLKEVYEKIYSNPIAAAILRVGVMAVIAHLVSTAFERYI